jgi:hypothetical protein
VIIRPPGGARDATRGAGTIKRWFPALLAITACQSWSHPRPVAPPPAPVATVELRGGGTASFRAPLEDGALYLLRAAGTVHGAGGWQDAEYAGTDGDPWGGADVVGHADVGVDVGLKQVLPASGRKPAPPSEQRLKWFEPFRSDHVYHLLVTGQGRALTLRLVTAEDLPPPGEGVITVSLTRLSPAPPALGVPLETVRVPAREKVTVRSRLVAEAGRVYLLQAAGEVQVGGPRHMGDAEFHDYKADGRGYNEGEGGVDFGVGVDDPVIGLGHDPRARKWGPYRRDHTYYLLYRGQGAPLVLNYHDTGGKSGVYKDNEGTLPVTIFPVP